MKPLGKGLQASTLAYLAAFALMGAPPPLPLHPLPPRPLETKLTVGAFLPHPEARSPRIPNLAYLKPVLFFPYFDHFGEGDPQLSTDGIVTGQSGFTTGPHTSPYWQVDLGTLYALNQIYIFRGQPAQIGTSTNLKVMLSLDKQNWFPAEGPSKLESIKVVPEGNSPSVTYSPLVGSFNKNQICRYVRLQFDFTTIRTVGVDEVCISGTIPVFNEDDLFAFIGNSALKQNNKIIMSENSHWYFMYKTATKENWKSLAQNPALFPYVKSFFNNLNTHPESQSTQEVPLTGIY